MKTLDELEKELIAAKDSEKLILQNEINQLKPQITRRSFEVMSMWMWWFGGNLIWTFGLAIEIALRPANVFFAVILTFLCNLVIYGGGAALLASTAVLAFVSISKRITISNHKAEIRQKENSMRE